MSELVSKRGPAFSVIVPVYNKADFVSRTIRSVLEQSYSQFECIVVDDGSTDGSLDILRGFRDRRIRIVSKPNGGVSSARNMGILESNYRYLALLDADDYWSAEYLEHMAKLVEKIPCKGLYFSSHFMVHSDGKAVLRESPELAEHGESVIFNLFEYFARTRKFGWSLHTSCCVLDKAAALNAGGFDERISFYEDYDLFSRIALQADFVYLNKPLSFYSNDALPEQRLTGQRPDIARHWANYILEGPLSRSRDKRVHFFVQNFAVFLLQGYRRDRKNVGRVSELRKLITPSMLSAKALAWHYAPEIMSSAYTRIRNGLRRRAG